MFILVDRRRRELSGGFRKTTNNRMELFFRDPRAARDRAAEQQGNEYSDAQYVVDLFNGGYAQQWRRDGWKRNKGKEPALNSDLWEDLLDICARHEVRFIWVRDMRPTRGKFPM